MPLVGTSGPGLRIPTSLIMCIAAAEAMKCSPVRVTAAAKAKHQGWKEREVRVVHESKLSLRYEGLVPKVKPKPSEAMRTLLTRITTTLAQTLSIRDAASPRRPPILPCRSCSSGVFCLREQM